MEKIVRFRTYVIVIEDELPEITQKASLKDREWLEEAIRNGWQVFNAPRPLAFDCRTFLNGPFGFFIACVSPDEYIAKISMWENWRNDATLLKFVTVAQAREMAETEKYPGYDAKPELWEKMWRDTFDNHFRRGTEDVTVEARY